MAAPTSLADRLVAARFAALEDLQRQRDEADDELADLLLQSDVIIHKIERVQRRRWLLRRQIRLVIGGG